MIVGRIMTILTGVEVSSVGFTVQNITFAFMGIMATLLGASMVFLLVKIREREKARDDFKNAVLVLYHEIKDNMITLSAGTQVGLMKVSTSGLDLLKAKNIYVKLPDDILRDVLSVYWYFNFINDIVNLELTLFTVAAITTVDNSKIFEINDHQAKETHRRCLKEIQKTRILSRLEELI
jgi:hypothetical protein